MLFNPSSVIMSLLDEWKFESFKSMVEGIPFSMLFLTLDVLVDEFKDSFEQR